MIKDSRSTTSCLHWLYSTIKFCSSLNLYLLYILSEGIEYSDTDLIAVRIKALNPGKAKIQATVQLPGGQKISTFVEVVGK